MPEPARIIGDDEPIPLAEACAVFFNGRVKPTTLRAEHGKGNLVLIRLGNKDFVTRRAVQEMLDQCQRRVSRPDSTSETSGPRPVSSPDGSSGTARELSEQDALEIELRMRKRGSRNTSQRSAGRTPASVVRLPSSSRQS